MTSDLVGTAGAAELLGIGRATWQREDFPASVAVFRRGPVWFRWRIELYQAEERSGKLGDFDAGTRDFARSGQRLPPPRR